MSEYKLEHFGWCKVVIVTWTVARIWKGNPVNYGFMSKYDT